MPLDFFPRTYIKTKAHKTKINDIADLKERIERKMKSLKKEILEKVFDGFIKRLKFCMDVNGDIFEQ